VQWLIGGNGEVIPSRGLSHRERRLVPRDELESRVGSDGQWDGIVCLYMGSWDNITDKAIQAVMSLFCCGPNYACAPDNHLFMSPSPSFQTMTPFSTNNNAHRSRRRLCNPPLLVFAAAQRQVQSSA